MALRTGVLNRRTLKTHEYTSIDTLQTDQFSLQNKEFRGPDSGFGQDGAIVCASQSRCSRDHLRARYDIGDKTASGPRSAGVGNRVLEWKPDQTQTRAAAPRNQAKATDRQSILSQGQSHRLCNCRLIPPVGCFWPWFARLNVNESILDGSIV